MADPQDDGWQTVTDPNEIPADVRKSIGVVGVRKAFGIGENDKPLPDSAAKRVEDQVSTYAALKAAAGGFIPAYAGNAWTGETENLIQSKTGWGTPGQRDWWAKFRQVDNQIRNDLFGAALTPSEQAAYEATTISPSMDPEQVKLNIGSRQEIIRKALGRRTAYLKANGYRPEAVDALLGEYGGDLQGASAQPKGGDPESGAAGVAGGSGAPPSDPNKAPPGTERVFTDTLPTVRAGSSRLTPEQEAYISAIAQRGGSADELIEAHKLFGKELARDRAEAISKAYQDPRNRNTPLPFDYSKDEAIKAVDTGDGATGSAARGAFNALTLGFGDEAGALVDTVAQGGTYDENLDRRRGQELFDEQNSPVARFGGQVIGSLPLGGIEIAGARGASLAAGRAAVRSGIAPAEARLIAHRVYASRTAAEAAGIGGVYGFGDAEGGITDRGVGAAIGAGTGAVLAGGATLAGGRFARAMAARRSARGTTPLTEGQQTLAAAERQNIVPFPADVGPAAVRNATVAAASTIGGVGSIRRGAQATIDSAQAVRDRVAASMGVAANPEAAGEAARAGANQYIATTGQRIGGIYDAAERLGGRAVIQTPEANRVLSQELATLRESPIAPAGLSVLEGLEAGLQNGTTVRGLRAARTALRSQFEAAGLRQSNEERVAGRVLDAATDDIVNGLRAQGLDRAANAYRRADRLWSARLRVIDDELEPILGGNSPKSGEEVMQALKGAMQGNNRRFVGFLNALPANEQGVVRASLVQRLGQATKGNQDETGEVFSLPTFLTHWNEIGETAKMRLFGTDGRAALNDLARVAAGSKQAQRFANTSNTGATVTTTGLATGAVAGGLLSIIPVVATVAAQYGAGRLLASPRFARWLARAPRQPSPAAQQAWVERLARVARAEPVIANDVLALQSRLAGAFGSTPARLAADETGDRPAVADGQNGQSQTVQQGFQP